MKYSLGISNYLDEISSLSHSIVFLFFIALVTEEGFLISPFYSLELFMANRWGNSDRLFLWGSSKITTDGDCSHEIKRHLLLGRKIMTN